MSLPPAVKKGTRRPGTARGSPVLPTPTRGVALAVTVTCVVACGVVGVVGTPGVGTFLPMEAT